MAERRSIKEFMTKNKTVKYYLADDGTMMDEQDYKLYKKVSNKPTSHKDWLAGYWKWRKTQDETR